MRDFFQKIENKRLFLTLILIGGFIYVIFMIFVLILLKEVDMLQPSTTTNELEKDYSSLDDVVPGKSTQKEVEKINGKPESTDVQGVKTNMYYDTPLDNFTNQVVLENDRVVYSVENVFGNYRGTIANYKAKYGEPELLLYDRDNYPIEIYLSKGIAYKHGRTEILAILYFTPQSKETFMNTVAKDLLLRTAPLPDY